MSATATPTAAERYREIRALQLLYLNAADEWPAGSAEQQQNLAGFDILQAEKEQLQAVAATRENPDPERTAIHEAGHAVALRALGWNAVSLSIVPRVDSDGHCKMPADIDGHSKAVALLAGAVAEEQLCGSSGVFTDASDEQMVAACIGRSDDNHYFAAKAKAREIIARNGNPIMALARAILDHKTLTGDEVLAVFSRHWVR